MGRLNNVLSFIRVLRKDAKVTDVKCDPGGGANVTAEHFSPPGDDSHPLTTDAALTVPRNGSGRESVVGYINPSCEQKAEEGEKRIYARNSSGVEVAEVWLKNDGTLVITNGSGTFEMLANGDVDINGATITAAGEIITASGINLDTHTHPQNPDSDGDTQQPTGAPL